MTMNGCVIYLAVERGVCLWGEGELGWGVTIRQVYVNFYGKLRKIVSVERVSVSHTISWSLHCIMSIITGKNQSLKPMEH